VDPWGEQRRKLALIKAAAAAAADDGWGGGEDAAVVDIEQLHEADMEKLAMLHVHIQVTTWRSI